MTRLQARGLPIILEPDNAKSRTLLCMQLCPNMPDFKATALKLALAEFFKGGFAMGTGYCDIGPLIAYLYFANVTPWNTINAG